MLSGVRHVLCDERSRRTPKNSTHHRPSTLFNIDAYSNSLMTMSGR
jgi:hypothetical protein